MSNFKSISPSMLRIDTSRTAAYLGADKPKLTLGQKIGRVAAKVGSALLPIGSAIAAVTGNLPLAAGLYGLGRLSSDVRNVQASKDATKMQEFNNQMAQTPISLPGLFEGMSETEIATDFIAPSEFNSGIQQTLIERDAMDSAMRSGFKS